MTTRVSTTGNYSAVLANLMAAQQRQMAAGDKVATQKNGSDLKDYARHAETLTAMRTVQARLEVYADQNKLIADKLTTQDAALNQVTDSAAATRQSIADAIASGRGDTLMEDLQAHFRNAVEGMNARYAGKYLFAGGQIDARPVTAGQLSDLTAPLTAIADFFHNDRFKVQAKIDDSTTVTTGVLADEIGTDLLTAYRTMQAFHEATPFGGELTPAQLSFLEGQLATWDGLRGDLTNTTARNGLVQKRVDSVKADLVTRENTLAGMMGDITDADMPLAVSQLQMAQMSVQASAQVFMALQQTSLLNLLK
jgi:flagellar hook-associated protein 3 FlgL